MIGAQLLNWGAPDEIVERQKFHLTENRIDFEQISKICDIKPIPLVLFVGCQEAFSDRIKSDIHVRGSRTVAVICEDHVRDRADLWSLASHGCDDVQVWSDDACGDRVSRRIARWIELEQIIRADAFQKIACGQSACWMRAMRQVAEAGLYSDAPILITGETGSGKEVAARALAHIVRKSAGQTTIVDCASLSPTLFGSELFGHERGAFTGAAAARAGSIELADGGVLFLDEIGELPLDLQPQFLRVLQEGTYRRLGGNTWRSSQFRLVCATNRDLEEEVKNGRFRADLYHRIAAFAVKLPSLRDRPEDIMPLAARFIQEAAALEGDPVLDPGVCDLLMRTTSKGNVRALKQLCRRIAASLIDRHVSIGDVIMALPDETFEQSDHWHQAFRNAIACAVEQNRHLSEIKEMAADHAIAYALSRSDGSVAAAAKQLGVTPRALQVRQSKKAG